ncbi:hypothetical protein P7K49_035459, partial [Saguinus oedipus]
DPARPGHLAHTPHPLPRSPPTPPPTFRHPDASGRPPSTVLATFRPSPFWRPRPLPR